MRHRWGVYTCAASNTATQNHKLRASNELKPVRVLGVKLFVTVNGLIGDVAANLRFSNHLPHTSPAIFLFPLTHNTAVKQCRATITSGRDSHKRSVGVECRQIQEKERDVKAGFVIEQSTSDVVELQLGFISPGDEVDVTLQYAVELDVNEGGLVRFLFPTFLPRQLQSTYTELCAPEVYNAIDLQCRAVISGVYRIHKILSDQRLQVGYKDEQRRYVQIDTMGLYAPVKDFSFSILYASIDKPHIHLHTPISEKERDTHWLMSSYCAHLTMHHNSIKTAAVNRRNEYILCIDRSGSMYGSKMEHVKEALSYFVRFLQPGSFFNIVSYGSVVEPLFRSSQKVTPYTAMKAMKLKRLIKADMFGTNIHDLLQFVYSHSNKTHNCKQVYLITDGAVEDTEACLDLVKRNADNTRLFTFGLDKTASRYLVSNLARVGNGKSYHLTDSRSLCHKVVEAIRFASRSSITDLSISVQVPPGLEFSTQPERLPTVVFPEETLSVCILLSGQGHGTHKTRCRVVVNGRVDRERFSHVCDLNLRDALVTHGSPLHQLAIRSHLSSLQRDVVSSRNAEEILDIHNEMADLSMSSNVVSSQTKYVSIDIQSRRALNNLPIILCRPENNLSPSATSGIDIFRTSQVMLKSLVSLYSLRSKKPQPAGKRPLIRALSTGTRPTQRLLENLAQSKKRKPEETNREGFDDHRLSVDRILSEVGGVRLAEMDTDSLQSTLINTDIDTISNNNYEEESLPPELFNIIEEYSDKGKGSHEDTDTCSSSEQKRPTGLLHLSKNRRFVINSGVVAGETSPKLTSTSDYYSQEVSPVSDVLSPTPTRGHLSLRPGKELKFGDYYRRNSLSSSSGVGSHSSKTYLADSSASSMKPLSTTTTGSDLEPRYTSIWKKFRQTGEILGTEMELDYRDLATSLSLHKNAPHSTPLKVEVLEPSQRSVKMAVRQPKHGGGPSGLLSKETIPLTTICQRTEYIGNKVKNPTHINSPQPDVLHRINGGCDEPSQNHLDYSALIRSLPMIDEDTTSIDLSSTGKATKSESKNAMSRSKRLRNRIRKGFKSLKRRFSRR